jgi:hypothetical protein
MINKELTLETHPLVTSDHLRRKAVTYIRQSSEEQVRENTGSADFQRGLKSVAQRYGWPESQIEIIDEDLGRSGSSSEGRTGVAPITNNDVRRRNRYCDRRKCREVIKTTSRL